MDARKKLVIMGSLTCLLYAALAFIAYFYQISSIPPRGYAFKTFSLLINLLLVLAYWVTFKTANKKNEKNIGKIVVLFSVVFSTIMILIPPIGSADVYNYTYRARVKTVYNENPYIVATENYSDDMFYNFSPKEWNYLTMQYGPLWASISIGFSNIAQDSFFWNIFLYKLLALFSFFAGACFLRKILQMISPDKKIGGLFLYLWNPLILFEAVNNAHNDMLMISIVLAAIYFLLKKKYSTSLLVLLLSVLLKYITLVIVPVFLYFVLKNIPQLSKKVKFVLKTGIAVIIVTTLFYIPFWEGAEIFKGLFQQTQLSTFFLFSLFPSLVFAIAYLVGSYFSWSYDLLTDISRYFGLGAFIVVYFWQIKNYVKDKSKNFIYYSFLILFAYIIYYVSYLQPWYLVWLIPIAILVDKKYFLQFIFILTLAGLLSYIVLVNSLIYILIFVIILILSVITKKNYFQNFLNFNPSKSERNN
ncbi:hypothetical protein KJ810_02330 [Patescibacteria group bacterium]|nr:hypothetical protein [Patescibacteria group bacterium]